MNKSIYLSLILLLQCIIYCNAFKSFGPIQSDQKTSIPTTRIFDYKVYPSLNDSSPYDFITYQNFNQNYQYTGIPINNTYYQYVPMMVLNSTTILLRNEKDVRGILMLTNGEISKLEPQPNLNKFKTIMGLGPSEVYYDDTLNILLFVISDYSNYATANITTSIYVYNMNNDSFYTFDVTHIALLFIQNSGDFYYDINKKIAYYIACSETNKVSVFTLNISNNETNSYYLDTDAGLGARCSISGFNEKAIIGTYSTDAKLTLYEFNPVTPKVLKPILTNNFIFNPTNNAQSRAFYKGINSRYIYIYNSNDNGFGQLIDLSDYSNKTFIYNQRNVYLDHTTTIRSTILSAFIPKGNYLDIGQSSSEYSSEISNSIQINSNLILIILLNSLLIIKLFL